MSRQDQYAVTVSVDGRDFGIWDSLKGGDIDSDELKYKPGGMAAEVSLGGPRMISNLKVARLMDLTRDSANLHWLFSRVGKGDVTVNRQALDTDANVYGAPLVYTGKLKTVLPGDVDSTSASAQMVEIEVSPAGTVG